MARAVDAERSAVFEGELEGGDSDRSTGRSGYVPMADTRGFDTPYHVFRCHHTRYYVLLKVRTDGGCTLRARALVVNRL